MSDTLPLVQSFLDYLVDERHFSPYTARCYGLDLRQYGEFLADEFNISRERIRQIEVRAFEKLQKSVRDKAASLNLLPHIEADDTA